MDKMDGMTMNIEQANVEKLKEVFPEVFADGKVDFDKLQGLLGHYIADDKEKYSFSWKGKADSLRLAQKRSTGTLRPCKEESKDWDTTGNLYIEGDNLEVLKLLQSAYLNSVKMIYIDPPYNTGNDFVYTDDFADGIAHYKEVTGQATKSNPETAGRYHTNWLNMMYPRLKLARNLLTDDGVIFISIGNQEISNLKKIGDEIFGEDNCLGIIAWESKTKCQNTSTAKRQLQNKQEYIIAYKKAIERYEFNLVITEAREYPYEDESGKYRIEQVGEMSASGIRGRNSMIFEIDGVLPKKGNQWKFGIETIREFKERNDIVIKDKRAYFKIREIDEEEKMQPFWSFFSKEIGTAETAKKELKDLVGEHGFETVKPVELIKKLVFHVSKPFDGDIILDFFSGSATTAHAVMQLNAEDGGHRRFICVQLPEKTDEQSEAYKAGYKTICEIGKERIRRAGEKIKADLLESGPSDRKNRQKINEGAIMAADVHWEGDPEYQRQAQEMADNLDIGFKVFKLDSSNLVKWDNTPTADEEEVKKRIQQSLFYLVEGRSDLDLVYEIMLKYGLSLTLPVKERKFGGVSAYIINHPDYKVLVCLQPNITLSAVEEMVKETIGTYIFADRCFADANMLSNTEEILKKKDKEMRLF